MTTPALNDGVNDAAERAAAISFINTQNSFSRLKAYGVLNGSLNFKLDGGMEFTLWGRNLTQAKYYNAIFNGYGTFGTAIGFTAAPRTWGATVSYRF